MRKSGILEAVEAANQYSDRILEPLDSIAGDIASGAKFLLSFVLLVLVGLLLAAMVPSSLLLAILGATAGALVAGAGSVLLSTASLETRVALRAATEAKTGPTIVEETARRLEAHFGRLTKLAAVPGAVVSGAGLVHFLVATSTLFGPGRDFGGWLVVLGVAGVILGPATVSWTRTALIRKMREKRSTITWLEAHFPGSVRPIPGWFRGESDDPAILLQNVRLLEEPCTRLSEKARKMPAGLTSAREMQAPHDSTARDLSEMVKAISERGLHLSEMTVTQAKMIEEVTDRAGVERRALIRSMWGHMGAMVDNQRHQVASLDRHLEELEGVNAGKHHPG